MKRRRIAVAVVAVVAVFLLAGWAVEAGQIASMQVARRGADDAAEGGHRGDRHGAPAIVPAAAGKGKALFEEKCSVCHELERSLSRTKSRSGWTAIVKRMQQVNGCPITDKEAAEIIDYLVKVRGPSGSKP